MAPANSRFADFWPFLALCLVSFLTGFANAPFNALLPVYVDMELERVPLFAGSLRSVNLILGGVLAVIAGRLCDVIGIKNTLLIGIAGTAIAGLVFNTHDVWFLLLVVAIVGAGSGFQSTAGQSYLLEAAPGKRVGLCTALFFLSGTGGNSVGLLVAGLLKKTSTFNVIGLAMVGGLLGSLLLATVFLPGIGQPQRREVREPMKLWQKYRPLLLQTNVHLFIGMRGLTTAFWGLSNLLLPLLVARAADDVSAAAYFLALSLSVAACCQLTIGHLGDRYGRRWPLLASYGGVLLSGVGLAMSVESLAGLFVFGTILTAAAWSASTLVPGLIHQFAGPEETNRLIGLGHMVWSSAMVAGSLLGGFLQTVVDSKTGLSSGAPFAAGTALAAGGSVCAWGLLRRLERGVV